LYWSICVIPVNVNLNWFQYTTTTTTTTTAAATVSAQWMNKWMSITYGFKKAVPFLKIAINIKGLKVQNCKVLTFNEWQSTVNHNYMFY
jgi:hypothetical protein